MRRAHQLRHQRRSGHRPFTRGLAIVLTYFATYGILFPPNVMPQVWGQEATARPTPAADGVLTAEQIESMARDLYRINQVAKSVLASMSAYHFEPAALAEHLQYDSEALFTFVRDQTWWVPYHKALRGPQGVMLDRLGNSLDRSLLLAALLDKSGFQTRLCHVELDEAAGRNLLQQMPRPPGISDRREQAEPQAKFTHEDFGLTEADLAEAAAEADEQRLRAAEEAIGRAQQQAVTLVGALEAAGVKLGDGDEQARELNAIRSHWWVECRKHADAHWLAMDPMLPGHQPGDALAAPQQTFEPQALPDTWWQTFTFRVVVERHSGKDVTEETALEHVVRPADHIGQRTSFYVLPQTAQAKLGELPSQTLATRGEGAQDILDVLADETQWLPTLRLGDKLIDDKAFTASGALTKPIRSATGEKAEQAIGALSGLGATKKADTILSGVWIEFKFASPENPGEPQTLRRTIYDAIGPTVEERAAAKAPADRPAQRRRGAALCCGIELLLQVCWLPEDYQSYLALQRFTDSHKALQTWIQDPVPESLGDVGMNVADVEMDSAELSRLAQRRLAWSADADRLFIGEPNVAGFWQQLGVDDQADFSARVGLDLIHTPVAVLPEDDDAPAARLRQGVLETVVEASVLTPPENTDVPVGMNTAVAFDAVPASGWRVIHDEAGLPAAAPGADDTAGIYIRDALDRGDVVVLATKDGGAEVDATAWWEVDPETGQVIGRNAYGWGGELVPYEGTLAISVKNALVTWGVAKAIIMGLVAFAICMAAQVPSPICVICAVVVAAASLGAELMPTSSGALTLLLINKINVICAVFG